MTFYSLCWMGSLIHGRSMPRKLPRKHVNAKSRRESAIVTLTASDNGNEESVAVAVYAVVVAVDTSIDVRPATQDPHLPDDVGRLIATTIEGHHPGGKWIRISLALGEYVVQMKEDVVHHQFQARSPAPDLGLSRRLAVGCATMTITDPPDAATIQADLPHHLLEEEVSKGERRGGFQIVVITEQDPLHL